MEDSVKNLVVVANGLGRRREGEIEFERSFKDGNTTGIGVGKLPDREVWKVDMTDGLKKLELIK